tara:strand:- start:522 stop:683 length:162 start_codon:yes stop_codon:yes gene_type:complete
MMDFLVKSMPMISAVLYAIAGLGYFFKEEYAWAAVWSSYALANVALVAAAWEV